MTLINTELVAMPWSSRLTCRPVEAADRRWIDGRSITLRSLVLVKKKITLTPSIGRHKARGERPLFSLFRLPVPYKLVHGDGDGDRGRLVLVHASTQKKTKKKLYAGPPHCTTSSQTTNNTSSLPDTPPSRRRCKFVHVEVLYYFNLRLHRRNHRRILVSTISRTARSGGKLGSSGDSSVRGSTFMGFKHFQRVERT